MSENGHKGEGNGATVQEHVTVITVCYHREQELVTVQIGKDVKLGLAQMMLDEAVRQLGFLRRRGEALDMQRQAQEAARVQALVNSLSGKG